MLDHHPDNPHNVKSIFEGAKYILKGTNTSTSKSVATTTSTTSCPGLVPAAVVAMSPPVVKSEPANNASTSMSATSVVRLVILCVEIPHAKEYHPAPPAALAPAPGVPSTPIVDKALEPVPHPATSAPVASASNAQPPLHPFSGIPNHYVPLNT
ncbi:hypothetical protein E4T56_gene9647, partial [Termitomyces sp. T112]